MSWVVTGLQNRRIDENALKNAGKTGEEWLTYGLNYGETRYSPLKQIDAGNVSRLGSRVDLRDRTRRRQSGRNAPDGEWRRLRHHELEHDLRASMRGPARNSGGTTPRSISRRPGRKSAAAS